MALTNQDTLSHAPPTTGTYAYNAFKPGAAGFPAVGGTYADPVFGGVVRRLTNMVGSGYYSDIYAHHWANADGTLAFHQNGSGLQIISTTTGATTYANQPQSAPTYELYWDMVDPNLYYFYSGANLMVRNLSSGTSSVKKTFPTALDPLGGSLNFQTGDGRYFIVSYSGAGHVWDSQLDLIYSGSIPYNTVSTNGWITITPSGRYCVTPSDGTVIANNYTSFLHWSYPIDHVNHTIGTGIMFWSECGDHGVVLSASDGKDYFVTHACYSQSGVYACTLDVDRRALGSGNQVGTTGVTQLINNGWDDNDGHLAACSRGTFSDWAFVNSENFTDDLIDSSPTWAPYKQEIIAVNVITGEVRRLAHHRSRSISGSYYRQPRVSCSADGSVVLWVSNFNTGTPVDYSDMYAVNNPLVTSSTSHTASGALIGSSATIAGQSSNKTTHATTGALTGAEALVVGTASRWQAGATHESSGSIAATDQSIIVGVATRTPKPVPVSRHDRHSKSWRTGGRRNANRYGGR